MPMYLNNVPLSGQTLGITRVPINQNFVNIDTAFQVDHQPYTLSGQGKHNKVTFPRQSSAPSFTGTDVGLFNQVESITGVSQIWATIGAASSETYPMSASLFDPVPVPPIAPTWAWFYTASGLLVQHGYVTLSVTPNQTVNFHRAFPNQCLFASVFPKSNNLIQAAVTAVSTTSMTVLNNSNVQNGSVWYLAIGY